MWVEYTQRLTRYLPHLRKYLVNPGARRWNPELAGLRDQSHQEITELNSLLQEGLKTMPAVAPDTVKLTRCEKVTRRLGLHPGFPLGRSRRMDERVLALRPSVALMILYPDPVIVDAVDRRLHELGALVPVVYQVLIRFNPVLGKLNNPRPVTRGWKTAQPSASQSPPAAN